MTHQSSGNHPSGDHAEELLGVVAHELRRPLTALLGALATIHQRGPALSAAQNQELLTIARRQGAQLQQLLEQLLVAATPPPGAPIRLIAGPDGTQAVLAVQDQGAGIPTSERGRIFARYARLEGPTGPRATIGVGLKTSSVALGRCAPKGPERAMVGA